MEGSPKFSSEEGISVRDEVQHEAIFAVPFIEKYNGNLGSGICGVGTSNAYVSTKEISHGQDGVFSILLWEWANEVQGD
jgi:hypothetical protein